MKKKMLIALGVIVVLIILGSAFGGDTQTDGTETTDANSKTTAVQVQDSDKEYSLKVLDAKLSKDYEGKDVVIVTYEFSHTKDEPTSFMVSFDDCLFQNDIGLNESYLVDDDSYSSDNQMKEIKSGAKLEVQVAYELNDVTTPINVEITELISLSDELILDTVIEL